MSLHILKQFQLIPASLQETWNFFSSPLNLDIITPPNMKFDIISEFQEGDRLKEGMLIRYKVSPLFNIPLNWTTEIIKVSPLNYFIDEQRKGPFAFWHHEHFFTATDKGVEIKDVVKWSVPGRIFGDFINLLVVRKRVEDIFAFRKHKIEELFGKK